MLCLSIQQPWAWAILNCGKDIENRSWQTKYRGPILIHAGKKRDDSGVHFLQKMGYIVPIILPMGGIVGMVDIEDCVASHTSKWFFGEYGFVLKKPVTLRFHPMKGQLNLFLVDDKHLPYSFLERP